MTSTTASAREAAGRDEADADAENGTPTPSPPMGPAHYVIRWFPVAIIPMVALLLFTRLNKPISDPDTFWHLRLGAHLSDTWRFSGAEPWSALAERPLVLHEWAPELLYVWVFRAVGWPGLSYLQAVGGIALLLTLYICTRRFSPPLIAATATLAGWAGTSGSVALRPQIVSFILLAIFVTSWLRTLDDGQARWWLIPLTWAWACAHGMWFVGVGIGAAVIVGMALDRKLTWRRAARLALIPVGGTALAALTPVGPRLLASAGGMTAYTEFVSEWQTPSPFLPQSMFALGTAAVLVLAWTRGRVRPSWTELILLALGVGFALVYARTIALGAIILSILAARALAQIIPVRQGSGISRSQEAAVLGLGLSAVLLVGPLLGRADVSGPARVPTALSPALDQLPPDTRVFNGYLLGGWLLWQHPELDPVIDGRADVYSVEHFERVMGAYAVSAGWEDTIRDTGVSAAILPADSGLAAAMTDQLGWSIAARDEGYVLLQPAPTP